MKGTERGFTRTNFSQNLRGFTLIEIIVVLGILATILSIGYVRAVGIERRAPVTATVNTFIADLRGVQTRAMTTVNQNSDSISVADYSVPEYITITTTFPGSVIAFTKGSGDIAGFVPGNNTVTITQTLTGEHKIITINRYGAVTQVQ